MPVDCTRSFLVRSFSGELDLVVAELERFLGLPGVAVEVELVGFLSLVEQAERLDGQLLRRVEIRMLPGAGVDDRILGQRAAPDDGHAQAHADRARDDGLHGRTVPRAPRPVNPMGLPAPRCACTMVAMSRPVAEVGSTASSYEILAKLAT